MKVYSFSEARQQFSAVLDQAQADGSVRVARRDGRVFVIRPLDTSRSPLDVAGVDLALSRGELLDAVHEGRRV